MAPTEQHQNINKSKGQKGKPQKEPSMRSVKGEIDQAEKGKWSNTLLMPKTSFPMRADLLQRERLSLRRWNDSNLYQRAMEHRAGAIPFEIHDGPPYPNGSIHHGHMVNKTLKDVSNRYKLMQGFKVRYVPGWDCHGLPIEHKVLKLLEDKGKLGKLAQLSDDQRLLTIRRMCKEYADDNVRLHIDQMKHLLTLGDYSGHYTTMQPKTEASTLFVLAEMVQAGVLSYGRKPVYWSPANKTALAEAELEYMDRTVTSIYIGFKASDTAAIGRIFNCTREAESGLNPSFLAWTTTPWSLVANQALAIHPNDIYLLVQGEGGRAFIVAQHAIHKIAEAGVLKDFRILGDAKGEALLGLSYEPPYQRTLREKGPSTHTLVDGQAIIRQEGTGLVHIAPGHGLEDYRIGEREKLDDYSPVDEDGCFDSTAPQSLRGRPVLDASSIVIEELKARGWYVVEQEISHSYPHDWRSKTPVLCRSTSQWFICMDKPLNGTEETLRSMGLKAVDADVTFVPEWGKNRMRGMIESRPDWCISRQRAWGIPIPAFKNPDGSVFMTPQSIRAVSDLVAKEGTDCWYHYSVSELLANYDPASDPLAPEGLDIEQLKKTYDTLDVWFESGSTWYRVMGAANGGDRDVSNVWIEGSDQHRGWFQSSLYTALALTGAPPFETIVTHGFVVDKTGRKLSKSSGDSVESLFESWGSDVLRWWATSQSYYSDIKFDLSAIEQSADSYKKIRNTLRFMLSNVDGCSAPGTFLMDKAACSLLPKESIHRWILNEFDKLIERTETCFENYDFRGAHENLVAFCNEQLSAIYLFAVKDRLYCDSEHSIGRQQTQQVLAHLTEGMTRLLAPLLPHTSDEAFRTLHGAPDSDIETTVHLCDWPRAVEAKVHIGWEHVMHYRSRINQLIEEGKAKLGISNTLDFGLILPNNIEGLRELNLRDIANIFGVSRCEIGVGLSEPLVIDVSSEPRCERSRIRDGTVLLRSNGALLSERDALVLGVYAARQLPSPRVL